LISNTDKAPPRYTRDMATQYRKSRGRKRHTMLDADPKHRLLSSRQRMSLPA
jgi:hypothetical protein